MRVVAIAPFGLRPKGTLSSRVLPLSSALRDFGYDVHIVAPSYLNPQDAGSQTQIDGVRLQHMPLSRLPGPVSLLHTAAVLAREALALRPNLVHVYKPKGYSGLAAALLRRARPGLPVMQDTDDWEGWGGWNDLQSYSLAMKYVFAWQERALLRSADLVTVASRTLQTQAWGFGIPPQRVAYLPNGVGPTPLLPDRAVARVALGLGVEPLVLLYTRFWEYPIHLIGDFLVALRALQPDARLLVIGAGERGEGETLISLAARAGLAAHLDWRGWSERAVIDQAMAAADIAIMPFADTLVNRAKCSVKLLELLNAAVPVVASAVGQATEYIHHAETGLLVSPGSGVELARAAARLLNQPAEARALGLAAQQYLKTHLRWDQLARELVHQYEWALA
ncbi:MAG: glycosyltransferase family 4 protein [Herpetosiphon sp.]